MAENSPTAFVLTLPCYFLATTFNADQDGNIIYNDALKFITPTVEGEEQVALFTDLDSAEQFRMGSTHELHVIQLSTVPALIEFLRQVRDLYRCLRIDQRPNRRTGRSILVEELLRELEKL